MARFQEAAADTAAQTPAGIEADTASIWSTVDNLIDGFLSLLPKIAIALVVFVIFVLLARLAKSLIRRSTDGSERANVGMVLGRLAQMGILLAGLIVAVGIVAPTVGAAELLSLLGVGGVAIGFAFRDILQNYVAGILILLRQPFEIGDQIVFNDFEGTVDQIETRATLIKTYDGRRVVIPNGEIYTNSVMVNTAYENRRSQYDVGIGYGDDIGQATRAMLEAMKEVEGVLDDPAPDVLAVDLAGSSVNLRARWWTKPERADVIKITDRVITAIKNRLDDESVDMPYPTQVVLFHDQTEATDGDRTQQREGWPAGENPPEPRTIAGTLAEQQNGNSADGNGQARSDQASDSRTRTADVGGAHPGDGPTR